MKKLYFLILTCIATVGVNAQCTTTYNPSNDCSSFSDQIDAFTLNSISSTGSAGCSANGYGSFSTPVWNVVKGGVYAWSALVGNNTYAQGFAMWIDLNNDGIYANSEMVYSSSSTSTSHSGNLTIPFTAATGNNIAMRIRCAYSYNYQSSEACTDYPGNAYGETEDYKINIACPAAPSLSVTATSTHICIGQTLTLTAAGAPVLNWSGSISNGVGFSPSSTTSYTVTGGGISGCSSSTATAVKTISVSTTPLSVSAVSSTNTVCAGNAAVLTAGGAQNYTWMPVNQTGSVITVAPNSSTTYTLVGYNGQGCPGTAMVSMNVNPVPVVSAVATPSNLCAGLISTLTVSGASTYSWQSFNSSQSTVTVSPQSSTSYAVLGFNSFGCSATAMAVIIAQPAPATTASASKTLVCLGSSADLTAGGADTYVWENGPSTAAYQVTPTANTIYTVTGTGTNGCTKSATVGVSVFQATIAVSQNTAICDGGSTSISAGAATAYSWNTAQGNNAQIFVTPTLTTVYMLDATVTVNNTSCKASNSVTVTVNPNPVVIATAPRATICRGETTTITAAGASSYLWNTNVATPSFTIKGNAAQTIKYTVTGTDANSCKGTASVTLKVDLCQSIDESSAVLNFNAFPNPNSGSFTIKAQKSMTLIITNELGQIVKTISLNSENLYGAEVSGLSAGVYFVTDQDVKTPARNKIVVLK